MERGFRVTSFETDPLTQGMDDVPLRVGTWPNACGVDGAQVADFLADDQTAVKLIEAVHGAGLQCAITFTQSETTRFVIVEALGPAAAIEALISKAGAQFHRLPDYRRNKAHRDARMLQPAG